MSNYDDKKTRSPPGWEYLTSEEGFHGLYDSDVVRAALWRVEVWDPNREKEEEGCRRPSAPEPPVVYSQGLNATNPSNLNATNPRFPGAIPYLDDYGNAPDGFDIPICHSWLGETISNVDSKHNNNAPCQCDSPNPAHATSWSQPTNWTMAYTKKFIKDSGLYNFDNFGKKCKSCNKMGVSWKALLKLEDEEKPAKHMKHAWNGGCESKSHKSHPPGPPQLSDPAPTSSSTASPASGTPDSCSPTPTREPIVQATTELVGHETRYLKSTPKNITRQGACNGPYCIVDTVYIIIIEQNYGYNVDSSVRAGEHACYAGDDWCVEQSAHDICEYPDEPEENAEEDEEEEEEEEEEVGEDEDEYADFIQDDKTPDNKSPVDKTPDDKSPNGEAQKEKEPTPEKDEATRKFEESLNLANWRWGCICGGNGTAGQHGIKCFDKGVTTKTTTIKGRMKQTHTPGRSASGILTDASEGGVASTDTEEVVTVTKQTALRIKTVYETMKRDATLQAASELPNLAISTKAPVFLPSSYASFAPYPTVTMN